MPKEKDSLPTPEELKHYRSKTVTGSYIGQRQLTKVFAALDAAIERAERAEQRLAEAEQRLAELENSN